MAKARIAARGPIEVHLEPGQYHWCACGRSKNQPFCDGSHVGTGIRPVAFTVAEDTDAWLCQCKQTGDAPYCDSTHKTLPEGVMELESRHSIEASSVKPEMVAAPSRTDDEDDDNAPPPPVNTREEPTVEFIHALARDGLKFTGKDGPIDAMGVPRAKLPHWDDIQILTAQLANRPLQDDAPVETSLVIGPNAKKPLQLDIPLLVSDMSFGAISLEAKLALAMGAELAGTGICSGEGGMPPEAQQNNSRYFYELASAKFGWDESIPSKAQAFHFKGGQAAKTGTGGHLPGAKVSEQIAAVRHLPPSKDAISPAAFTDMKTATDFKDFADRVRELSGGIPIGFKLTERSAFVT